MARVEHANITVSEPVKTARYLGDIFGWKTRWEGEAINGGYTIHVGENDSYVAIYRGPGEQDAAPTSYSTLGGFNHLGVVVDDLDAVEARVKAAGFEPHSHANYEPGRRFYFHDHDGIEIEVVCYT